MYLSWLYRRLGGLARLPSLRHWGEALFALCLFALVAYPLAERMGLFARFRFPGLGPALLLLGRVLLAPALLEEALFRGLLNPPPGEASPKERLGWGALSLVLYVGMHPFLAWLLRPAALPVFTSAAFLLLAALLGLLCLTLYLRSGSLWGAALLHAAVVVGWAFWGGLDALQR